MGVSPLRDATLPLYLLQFAETRNPKPETLTIKENRLLTCGSLGSGVGIKPLGGGEKNFCVNLRPKIIGYPSARHCCIASTLHGMFIADEIL